jgi:carbamoyltransferase
VSIILGINGAPLQGHDPAAALIVDGTVMAAVEEERLCRVKKGMGLPPEKAVQEVVQIAGLKPADVDTVALPWTPHAMGYDDSELEENLRSWLASAGFRGREVRIRFVDHHAAHACSGLLFVPKLKGKKFCALVIDGSGESTGGAAYLYDGELKCLWHLEQESSLGIYYEAATNYLGFNWGEEGKTMGLAAYGRRLGLEMPDISDKRFAPPLPVWSPEAGSPKHRHEKYRERTVKELEKLYGDNITFNRRADIALAAQDITAQRIMSYVRELTKDVDGLVLAGGVALNCAINETVADYCRTNGIEFVVPPPASDTGVALGAAISAFFEEPGNLTPVKEPFLGAHFTPENIAARINALGFSVKQAGIAEIASLLFDKNYICGWFEGRSEIGPRALGRRCIIARPDSIAIRDKINVLKGRETWRPLAPSLTAAEFKRSFSNSVPSHYMLINATNTGNSKSLRGIIHVDGTARPQVVDEAGPYLSLLTEAGKISGGCETVICTSFNRAGEPIVYTPEEALASARAMHLDALAGDGWIAQL